MKGPTVLILLATYNGEKFVRQMVDSVLAQDFEDIKIILSDDGSKDSTTTILDEYAEKFPEKVTHYRSGLRFGCAQKHFMHLLKNFHNAPYIMFCDQDDIWHKDKIRLTLEKMSETEGEEHAPTLVHTDLRVVDGTLNEIAPSFCENSVIDGNRVALNQILVQNVVTGCTVMLNRALAEIATSKDGGENEMLMHDWWLAILAAAVGKIAFLNKPTIDYRQHGNNSVGAKNVYSPSYLFARLKGKSMKKAMQGAARQSEAFLRVFGECLNTEQTEMLGDFAKTQNLSIFKRNAIYRKYKLYKNGFIRVVVQFLGI